MVQKLFSLVQKHERLLSAGAMVSGFVTDSIIFTKLSLVQTQLVFLSYTLTCFIAIPLLHWIGPMRRSVLRRLRLPLVLATQFALGGFWSGFVILYGRAADLGASWLFLLFLFCILLANEYFKRFHARLVFTSILFFFALYSFAIYAVPIYTKTIGIGTFLLSGLVAVLVFLAFTGVLRLVARERFYLEVRRIRLGVIAVLVVVNAFYFSNVLPPLPLSAEAAGVYYSLVREGNTYRAIEEVKPWQVHYLGFSPTLHMSLGDTLVAYSSIFAPTRLSTTIVHRWQHYDEKTKRWTTTSRIEYGIHGGREAGYRGYTEASISEAGRWRVLVETGDGRRITEVGFHIETTPSLRKEETVLLN